MILAPGGRGKGGGGVIGSFHGYGGGITPPHTPSSNQFKEKCLVMYVACVAGGLSRYGKQQYRRHFVVGADGRLRARE